MTKLEDIRTSRYTNMLRYTFWSRPYTNLKGLLEECLKEEVIRVEEVRHLSLKIDQTITFTPSIAYAVIQTKTGLVFVEMYFEGNEMFDQMQISSYLKNNRDVYRDLKKEYGDGYRVYKLFFCWNQEGDCKFRDVKIYNDYDRETKQVNRLKVFRIYMKDILELWYVGFQSGIEEYPYTIMLGLTKEGLQRFHIGEEVEEVYATTSDEMSSSADKKKEVVEKEDSSEFKTDEN